MRLIRKGLRELKAISGSNDFYFAPLLLLSAGYERLGKGIYCFHHLATEGSLPRPRTFPAGHKGHDVGELLLWITENVYNTAYLTRPVAQEDLILLRDDPVVARLVRVLSEFGEHSRYYHLDVVVGRNPKGPAPEQVWQEIEFELLKWDDAWVERLTAGNLEDLYEAITTRMVIPLEKVARALCRLFTLGPLGPEGRRVGPHLRPFLTLRDQELGRQDY